MESRTFLRAVSRFAAGHHNRIQFFGYEVANVVLVVHETVDNRTTPYGLTFETCAALALLVGSALIWTFDAARRPSMLYAGGLALTGGGLFLFAAGYSLTGLAVTVASMETARGGLVTLRAHVRARHNAGLAVAVATRCAFRVAMASIGWYAACVDSLTRRFRRAGHFINERPFVTGALIKAPARLEFVGKQMLAGDLIGAAVGLSWMLLGDGGLALNDAKLNALFMARSQPARVADDRCVTTTLRREAKSH